MSKIGKKITSRSRFTETILMVRKKRVGFKMFKKMSIEKGFKDFSNSGGKSNRAIVGRIRTVTLLRYRLHKRMLPRSRICVGIKNEAKKTRKHRRQLISKFL
jgi:hypothetical protein